MDNHLKCAGFCPLGRGIVAYRDLMKLATMSSVRKGTCVPKRDMGGSWVKVARVNVKRRLPRGVARKSREAVMSSEWVSKIPRELGE